MLYDELLAGPASEKIALIDQDKMVTYGELRRKVDHWARFLQQAGLQKGQRVGLFSRNCAEFVEAYFAVIRAGGVIVPLNFQLVPREIAFMARDTEMKLLISREPLPMDEAFTEAGIAGLQQFVFSDLDDPLTAPLQQYERQEEECCTIIYTSGTTCTPKGAMLSHKNLLRNARQYLDAVHLIPEDVVLCLLPMYHCYGWTVCITSALMTGATVVVQANYNFKTALRLVRKYKVSIFVAVPAVMELLLTGAEPEEVAGIRQFICGGASLGKVLGPAFAKKFGIAVMEGYGLSEASPVVSVNPSGRVKYGSIGPVLPGVTAYIVDGKNHILPAGQDGEVVVRGDNVMLGYLNQPEATKEAMAGGWLHTGDIGHMDEDGYIFLVDRLKDMVISSGENVYPREVENVIITYPGIQEAAVFGVPDRLRGQSITACLILEEGTSIQTAALRRYLLDHMAAYKVPRKYFIMKDFPRTALGKVRKNILRQQISDVLKEDSKAGRPL